MNDKTTPKRGVIRVTRPIRNLDVGNHNFGMADAIVAIFCVQAKYIVLALGVVTVTRLIFFKILPPSYLWNW